MSEIVAKVNGRPILETELAKAGQGLALETENQRFDQLPEEKRGEIRRMALERLVARELIFQEALAQGVVADEQSVTAEMNRIAAGFPNEEAFYKALEKGGVNPSAYFRMVRQDLTVSRMSEKIADEAPEPSAGEIDEFLRDHPEKLYRQDQVHVRHLLVKIEAGDETAALRRIEALRERAREEDFGQLAHENSDCPSAVRGGDLGYCKKGHLAKALEEAAFARPVGEVGEVIRTSFGFHLLQVLDRREAGPLPPEEARNEVRGFLRERHRARRLESWVEDLRSRAVIESV